MLDDRGRHANLPSPPAQDRTKPPAADRISQLRDQFAPGPFPAHEAQPHGDIPGTRRAPDAPVVSGRRFGPVGRSDGEGFSAHAAAFEEFADLGHIVLSQAVMVAVEGDFLAMQGYFHPVAAFRVQLRAERRQGMFSVLEVDIGADGMNEEGVQNFTVVMIHLDLDLLRPIDANSIKRSEKTSMTHIIWTHMISAGSADSGAARPHHSIG
jgi:hypothetical protein